MTTKGECLQLIEKVRAAGSDPESAYLVRTRLRRALLGSARFAAKVCDLKGPVVPGHFSLSGDLSPSAKELIELCNGIHAKTRRLCQPSEAFDARWKRAWAELLTDLVRLEKTVSGLPERESAA